MDLNRSRAATQQAPETTIQDWIIATDLDGTLLDHFYPYEKAAAGINELQRDHPNATVVLATSKTLAELLPFTELFDQAPPLIFENGAGLANPQPGTHEYRVTPLGIDHPTLRKVLLELRAQGYQFLGFADMSSLQVADITGLSLTEAQQAKERQFSEPLSWEGSVSQLVAFERALVSRGLTLVSGGRFHHVAAHTNKADALQRWLSQRSSTAPAHVVACGDAPNDTQMLLGADTALVFPHKHHLRAGNYMALEHKQLIRVHQPGPDAWMQAVRNLVSTPNTLRECS